jgi:hypothetical protein
MLSFFESIITFFEALWTFITQFISMIIRFFQILFDALGILPYLIGGPFPPLITGMMLFVIAVAIVKMLITMGGYSE